MKTSFFQHLLFLIVDCLCAINAFIKELYIPKRDYRLDGFIEKVVDRISNFTSDVKHWMYEMFARWHVDSYSLG